MKQLIQNTRRKATHTTACILSVAALLLGGCTQEDTQPGSDGNLPALALTTLQANHLSEETAATRATATVYPTSKLIGFFVKENTANGYTGCNNRKGEYNAARKRWLPTPDSIWLNNHDADIAVYAPYDAKQTATAALNLAACLRPADGSKDLWCKHFTANNKSTGLAPVLEHVYTRFTISMKLDANYKGMAPVDSVSLTGTDLYAVGVYQPFETTAYTYAGDAGVGFMLPSKINLTTASSTGSIDLLLIPATLTGDIKLSLTVNGITFGATLASSSFGGKLEAGKQYNASITLKPTALEVTSVTINDWNDETVSGEYEPVFVPQPEPIDIGLGFLIAWGNVVATKPAGSSTYEYAFADEQGYYSGKVNGGDYFYWCLLDPTASSPERYESYDSSLDPCRKVGDGQWRMPNYDDGDKIISMGYVGGTYTMRNGTKKNGVYFGTTVAPPPSRQDYYLFLPGAGSSWDGETLDYSSNSYGLYYDYGSWYPYCLYFSLDDEGKLTGTPGTNDGGSKNPLRCVKDKPKSKPEHAIEVEGLDFYVADGNVVATSDGKGGYAYAFAEEQGYYSGDYANGGDYFCWNTLDPTATKSTNATLVWNDADDVCRKIGDGAWYTPTNDQLQKLVDLYDNNKNRWGTYTMKSGTGKVAGMYCATASVPDEANQDKYVFLPAAGNRYDNGSGTITNKGTGGFYWSNTPYGNNYAREVYFFDSEVYHGTDDFGRYFGFSVRCVHDK